MSAARAPAAPVVALWIFLGSTTVLFAALAFAWGVLRAQSPGFDAARATLLPVGRALVSTAVLVASSVVLVAGQRSGARRAIGGALALGALFLVLQVGVARAVWERGTAIDGGLVRSLVILVAGVHGAHVLAAMAALVWTATPVLAGARDPERLGRLALAARFWHFVDATWIALCLALFIG